MIRGDYFFCQRDCWGYPVSHSDASPGLSQQGQSEEELDLSVEADAIIRWRRWTRDDSTVDRLNPMTLEVDE